MLKLANAVCLFFPFQLGLLLSQNAAGQLIWETNTLLARTKVGDLTYDQIAGSPYYPEDFIQGTLHLKKGDVVTTPLRLDAYQDEVEFRRDGVILWVIKDDVRYIRYGEETLIPEPVPGKPGEYSYFFVPESGLHSLYVKKKMDFLPYVPPKPYHEALPDRFEPQHDEYYLKKEGSPPVRMRNNKTISEFVGDNEAALDFVKKSKIRANDGEDLRELVRFLNNQ